MEQSSSDGIAIVVLTHNRAHLLQKCVENVLLRTSDATREIVIWDNASTDGTADYLASLDDPRIRVIRSEQNVGQNGYARAFRETSSPYLIELDDDVVDAPDGLGRDAARRVRALPDVGFLAADLEDDPNDEASRVRHHVRPHEYTLVEEHGVRLLRGPGRRRLRDHVARAQRARRRASARTRRRSSGSRTPPTSSDIEKLGFTRRGARRPARPPHGRAVLLDDRRRRRRSTGSGTGRKRAAGRPSSGSRPRALRPPAERPLRLVRRALLRPTYTPPRPDDQGPDARRTSHRRTHMRILITGGAGFVGSHLADELLPRGHAVHVLDDLSTGAIDNIRHLKAPPGFDYTIDSCHNAPLVARARRRGRHRLPPGRRRRRRADRREPRAHDRDQHRHDRGRAQRTPARRRSRSSSRRRARSTARAPTSRSARTATCCIGPTSRAAGPTRAPRRSTSSSRSPTTRSAGCPTVIGRMFNTVGPRQTGRYGMVVPNFVGQALAGQPDHACSATAPRAAASATSTDVVRALADLMETRATSTARSSTSAPSEEISIAGLADKVRELVGLDGADHLRPVRRGLRGGLRGHAAPRARHLEDPRDHRLGAARSRSTQIIRDVEATSSRRLS